MKYDKSSDQYCALYGTITHRSVMIQQGRFQLSGQGHLLVCYMVYVDDIIFKKMSSFLKRGGKQIAIFILDDIIFKQMSRTTYPSTSNCLFSKNSKGGLH